MSFLFLLFIWLLCWLFVVLVLVLVLLLYKMSVYMRLGRLSLYGRTDGWVDGRWHWRFIL